MEVWEARSRAVPLYAVFRSLTVMGMRGAWICLTFVASFTWNWIRRKLKARFARATEAIA
jgi:hypothetical protein